MTKEQRLKKRYRAEKRFKMYGLISVSLAVIFVLILVQNIFSKGSSAFSRTMIEVAVNYDSSLLELDSPINQNSLKDADFYDLAVESLLKIYPAKDSKEERQICKDLGNYFKIPSDNRDLNYDKFFFKGRKTKQEVEYNSYNTRRLSQDELISLLSSIGYKS